MKREEHSWKSPSLGKKMKLLKYGTSGAPVIIFPSEEGTCSEWEETGMIESLQVQINEGYNQFFCVDSIAEESLLNKEADPSLRIRRQMQYEQYITDEVIPFVRKQNSSSYLILSGAFLGAYYAFLIGLKHPELVHKVIGISGMYDIKSYLDGHYDDSAYFSNPIDFLPNLNDRAILKQFEDVDFRLLSYSNDPLRGCSEKISDLLWSKNINHKFYVWDEKVSDPWKLVDSMFIEHLF
ncbi:esterase [Rhodohalobacter sp. SW132]|uniref:esterase family protein n=1 Tax=Rhodohalobacter sp. SW132 TaxID=2293433 RepID=UPI000E2619C9|nr:alpha/beta hydrolase-fold protein [Rhodohalobacter sp. SW132]REL38330.1 esterase [Rhodohalobacter sp. SW132]